MRDICLRDGRRTEHDYFLTRRVELNCKYDALIKKN